MCPQATGEKKSLAWIGLSQGRYTWRHNSVLNHLVLALGSAYSASDTPPQIFADLPCHLSSSDSTIPSHVLPTSLRSDLVLLFPYRKIFILELTVPFETNISSARLRKSNRYAMLATLCSYAIFRSRSDPSWLTPPLLTIPSSDQLI